MGNLFLIISIIVNKRNAIKKITCCCVLGEKKSYIHSGFTKALISVSTFFAIFTAEIQKFA